jgi:uncharacterized membrane protein
MSMKDSHQRSFVKGVTWRMLGTFDTIVLSYFVTGELFTSLKIGAMEVVTKILLYYLHERLWNVLRFGRVDNVGPTHSRSLVKGVTWRIVGTLDTIFVALFITGQPVRAITIGGFEVFTKIFLFYLHERVWGRLSWGRVFDNAAATEAQQAETTAEEIEAAPQLAVVEEPVQAK